MLHHDVVSLSTGTGDPGRDASDYLNLKSTRHMVLPRGFVVAGGGVAQIRLNAATTGILAPGKALYLPTERRARLSSLFDGHPTVRIYPLAEPAQIDFPVICDLGGGLRNPMAMAPTSMQQGLDPSALLRRMYQSLESVFVRLPGRSRRIKSSIFERIVPTHFACEFTAAEHHSNTDIARRAAMSRAHFGRVFQAAFGQGPMEFRRCVRIANAFALLRLTSATTHLVAEAVGYQDRTAFSRAFSAVAGVTPAECRALSLPDRVRRKAVTSYPWKH